MQKIREASLYPIIGRFLAEQNYKVAYEIPIGRFHPRIFDVVGVNNSKVLSIEAKLDSFRRAFQQATTRLYYSDKVMVAFPEKYALHVNSVYRRDLQKTGIGLLSVDGNVSQKLEARQSTLLSTRRKKKLLAKLKLYFESEKRSE